MFKRANYIWKTYGKSKSVEEAKRCLMYYLKDKKIALKDIKQPEDLTKCEFRVGKRVYSVEDKKVKEFDENWEKTHKYKDFANLRVSEHYVFDIKDGSWYLEIGTEPVFTWRKRSTDYSGKTQKQLEQITDRFVKSYIKEGCPGDANPDVLRSAIYYRLNKLFGKTDTQEKEY